MLHNFLSAVLMLYCFIFLLMCCAICQFSFAQDKIVTPKNPIAVFKPDDTKFVKNDDLEQEPNEQFDSFTSPSLSYVGGALVVFAQAKKNGGDNEKCDIVEGYFEVKNDDKLIDEFEGTAKDLKTKRIVTQNDGKHCKGSPTTVVNKKKFFLFLNSNDTKTKQFKYEIAVNDVNSNNGKNIIKWKNSFTELKDKIKSNADYLKNAIFVGSGGPGIVVNNSFVVPLWYTTTDNKSISTIIKNASTTDDNVEWELVKSDSPVEGKYPEVVEWGEKIIMMISCSNGYRKVYESDKMDGKWKETVGSISGVWKNTEKLTDDKYGERFGFITVDIEVKKQEKKENVMLVTQPTAQPVTPEKAQTENKYNLHLWMTDNQRVSLA